MEGRSQVIVTTMLVALAYSVGDFKLIYDPEVGEKDPWCLNDHTFIKGPDKKWHMIGITHIKPFEMDKDPGRNLAHATADSLTQSPWRKEKFALTIDPQRYNEHLLWAPHITKIGSLYHMYVCAGTAEGHAYRIHHLTSSDLWSWTRDPDNPVLIDGFDARDPMLLKDGDRWILYYTANIKPEGGHHIVAAITSKDLKKWTKRQVVFTHPREGTFGGPTESPFVVRRGDRYYLFVTDNDTIHTYVSKDPMMWSPKDEVGSFRGHACEIVRDEEGRWFISHVGWMSGGLYIAPLTWHDGLDDAPTSLGPG
jgi:beta-fructofuranosidase